MKTFAKNEVKTKMKLRILSPIHIGDGNKISPWDFAIRSNYIFVIKLEEVLGHLYEENENKYQEVLGKLEKGEGGINEFLPSRIPDEWIVYKMSLHPGIDSNKVKEVATAIKNISPDMKPTLYIPASEVKGFIRTAIIYCYLRDNFKKFENKFKNIGRRYSFKDLVEKEIFGEVYEDPMKHLKIEDIYGSFEAEIIGVKILLSSKFWIENVEAITEGISKDFIIKLDKGALQECAHVGTYILNWKRCCYEFSKNIIDAELLFWKDLKRDGNRTKLIGKLKLNDSDKRDILKRLNRLNDKIINNVIRQLEYVKNQNTEETPLIRIGKFTGYLSHTVGVLINRRIDKYRHENQPYNVAPLGNDIGTRNAKGYIFPLTRRLTLDNQTLGWCKLEA